MTEMIRKLNWKWESLPMFAVVMGVLLFVALSYGMPDSNLPYLPLAIGLIVFGVFTLGPQLENKGMSFSPTTWFMWAIGGKAVHTVVIEEGLKVYTLEGYPMDEYLWWEFLKTLPPETPVTFMDLDTPQKSLSVHRVETLRRMLNQKDILKRRFIAKYCNSIKADFGQNGRTTIMVIRTDKEQSFFNVQFRMMKPEELLSLMEGTSNEQ